jgi:hypothetical protein
MIVPLDHRVVLVGDGCDAAQGVEMVVLNGALGSRGARTDEQRERGDGSATNDA